MESFERGSNPISQTLKRIKDALIERIQPRDKILEGDLALLNFINNIYMNAQTLGGEFHNVMLTLMRHIYGQRFQYIENPQDPYYLLRLNREGKLGEYIKGKITGQQKQVEWCLFIQQANSTQTSYYRLSLSGNDRGNRIKVNQTVFPNSFGEIQKDPYRNFKPVHRREFELLDGDLCMETGNSSLLKTSYISDVPLYAFLDYPSAQFPANPYFNPNTR